VLFRDLSGPPRTPVPIMLCLMNRTGFPSVRFLQGGPFEGRLNVFFLPHRDRPFSYTVLAALSVFFCWVSFFAAQVNGLEVFSEGLSSPLFFFFCSEIGLRRSPFFKSPKNFPLPPRKATGPLHPGIFLCPPAHGPLC